MPLYLAELDLDPRIIIAVIFVVFGSIKWIWENVLGKQDETKTREEIATELEDLYDQHRAKIVDQQTSIQELQPTNPPPIPQFQTPPPIPQPNKTLTAKPTKPQLTEAEKEALERLKQASTDLKQSRTSNRKHESSKIRELLKTPGTVRTAVVLQEVLGKPKGLN